MQAVRENYSRQIKGAMAQRSSLILKAEWFLNELESNYLEVVLIPDREQIRGGMIRVVQSQNAEWYRKFCSQHGSNRKDLYRWSKHKTSIKRQHTRRALRELIDGKCETPYAKMLKPFIERWEFEHESEWNTKAA